MYNKNPLVGDLVFNMLIVLLLLFLSECKFPASDVGTKG